MSDVKKIERTVVDYHHGLVAMRIEQVALADHARPVRILIHGNVIEASRDDLVDLYRVLESYFREAVPEEKF